MAWAVLLRMYAQRGLSASVALLRLITLTAPLESAEELIEALPRLLRGLLILAKSWLFGLKRDWKLIDCCDYNSLERCKPAGPPPV